MHFTSWRREEAELEKLHSAGVVLRAVAKIRHGSSKLASKLYSELLNTGIYSCYGRLSGNENAGARTASSVGASVCAGVD